MRIILKKKEVDQDLVTTKSNEVIEKDFLDESLKPIDTEQYLTHKDTTLNQDYQKDTVFDCDRECREKLQKFFLNRDWTCQRSDWVLYCADHYNVYSIDNPDRQIGHISIRNQLVISSNFTG